MCKISVIVPVYYTGAYLEKCINSVLAQSFTDFEILLINDGSCNEDRALCDKLAQKNSCIRVFHNENCGLAYSRNFGVGKARGEYVFFLDSDDYLSNDAFYVLYKRAEETDSDITMAGFIYETEDGNKTYNCFKNAVLDNQALSKYLPELKEKNLIDTCVDKLYKRSFLESTGVKMPVGEIFEDTAFNLELLEYNPKIVSVDGCFYHYVQRMGSITKKFNPEKLDFLTKRYYQLLKVSPENKGYWDYYYIQSCFSAFIDLYLPNNFPKGFARQYIKARLDNELFESCAKNAFTPSFYQRTVCLVAKTGNVFIVALFSKLLCLLKYKFMVIFRKIKG